MKFENQTFKDQNVDLDRNEFIGCEFVNCKFVYNGGIPPNMVNCKIDKFNLSFHNEARNTLALITNVYHGLGAGGKKLIEDTFDNIRKNNPNLPVTVH